MKTSFDTIVKAIGNNAGIEVPAANISELGPSKVPPVIVTVSGYSYKSTVAVMAGRFMIAFPKAHREASGFSAGDAVAVTLELDEGPRIVEMPEALRAALEEKGMLDTFSALAYSKRKEFCRQVADAKSDETRSRRVEKVIDALEAGRQSG